MKKWWLQMLVLVVALFLVVTGGVGLLNESFQLVVKKCLLLSLWYVVTYAFRLLRIGKIDWDVLGPVFKAYYYFILLLGGALIVAWG